MTTIRFDGEVKPSPQSTDVKTLEGAAQDVREIGVLLATKYALVNAIQDRRVERGHLRVLACIAEYMNLQTAKAWPGRQIIAEQLGVSPVTVSNYLRELRLLGYLVAERERVPESGNRSLTVYTFGMDRATIEREVGDFVRRIRETGTVPDYTKVTAYGDVGAEKVTAHGDDTSPPTVTIDPEVTAHGDVQNRKSPYTVGRKSPHTVDSNLIDKELIYTPYSPPCAEQGDDGVSPSAEQTSVEGPAAPDEKKAQRGTRLKPDWVLPKSWGEWALENFDVTPAQVRKAADEFADYWHSATGAKARKIEWVLVWRNWCRHDARRWRMKTNVKSTAAPDLLDIAAAKPKAMSEAEKLLAYEREMFGGDA